MSGLIGRNVQDDNARFSFFVIVAMGIFAFGTVIVWRSALLFSAEYQDLPVTHAQAKIKKANLQKQKSIFNNYETVE